MQCQGMYTYVLPCIPKYCRDDYHEVQKEAEKGFQKEGLERGLHVLSTSKVTSKRRQKLL